MDLFLSDISVKHFKSNPEKNDIFIENINKEFDFFMKETKDSTANFLGYYKEYAEYEPNEDFEEFLIEVLNDKLNGNFIGPDYEKYDSVSSSRSRRRNKT